MRKVSGQKMANNNFKVFNEAKNNIMSDTEYNTHIQRRSGVTSGVAISSLHNKLYRQTSIVAKAVADFVASQELDATDNDDSLFSMNLDKALKKITKVPLEGHRTMEELDHPDRSVTTKKIRDEAVTEAKLADNAVTTKKIKDKSVTEDKLEDKSVTMAKVSDELKRYLTETYVRKAGDTVEGDLTFSTSKGAIFMDNTNRISAKVYVNTHGTMDIGVNGSENKAIDNISLCSMNKPRWYNKNDGSHELATLDELKEEVKKYLPLKGGIMTGNITFTNNSGILINRKEGGGAHTITDGGVGGGQTNLDIGNKNVTPEANLCCYNRPGWYGKDRRDEFHRFALVDDINITTGVVRDGQYVPIPQGYSRDECTILVSLARGNRENIYVDIRESGIANSIQVECWVESNGLVHAGMWWRNNEGTSHTKYGNDEAYGDTWLPGEATYICIAKRKV